LQAELEVEQQNSADLCRQIDILKKALRSKAVEVNSLSGQSTDPNTNNLAHTDTTSLQFVQETKDSVRKRPKWSSKESARLIELRREGKSWDEISNNLPGRSPGGCRVHSSKSGFHRYFI